MTVLFSSQLFFLYRISKPSKNAMCVVKMSKDRKSHQHLAAHHKHWVLKLRYFESL